MKSPKEYRIRKIERYKNELPKDKVLSFFVKIATLFQLEMCGLFLADYLTDYDNAIARIAASAVFVVLDLFYANKKYSKEMRKERLETELRLQDSLNLDMAKECIKQEIDSISNRQKNSLCWSTAHFVIGTAFMILSTCGKFDIALTSLGLYEFLNSFDGVVKQMNLHESKMDLEESLELGEIREIRR